MNGGGMGGGNVKREIQGDFRLRNEVERGKRLEQLNLIIKNGGKNHAP
jgi:hypothetical protein